MFYLVIVAILVVFKHSIITVIFYLVILLSYFSPSSIQLLLQSEKSVYIKLYQSTSHDDKHL